MLTPFGTTFCGRNEQIAPKVRFRSNGQKFLIGACRASKSGTGNWRKGVTLMASGIETVFAAERATTATVLIVDDEDTTRDLCRDIVVESGLRTRTASTTEQALEILEQYPVDIIITDLRVPEIGGLELLKRVRETHPQTPVIVLTQYGTIESAVEATRNGAADYVTKPFHIPELRTKLDRVVRSLELDQENRVLREQLRTRPGFAGLIGLSPKMQRVYKLIEKVSQHNYPVLILGESGTGKELVARSIHFSGTRSSRPFAPVDCSSFVPTLIESELFGYVKGAFTGANQTKRGLMEAAGNGTLFLDEIGDLPIDLQAKLLRALQEKEIRPVGSTDRIAISVRVIAATNRDLEDAVRQGKFRQDLFFRLNVVQIKLPPLRERKDPAPGQFVPRKIQRYRRARAHHFRRRDDQADGLRLARERTRTRKRDRARCGPGNQFSVACGRFAVEFAVWCQ
jgi:DNA-binding NtrC family response regulator